MPTPHRVVANVIDGLAQGAQGVVGSIAGGIKGAGKTIMSALDKPPKALLNKEGPHRILDRFNDGAVDATVKAINEGGIGSMRTFGEGVSRALDQPPEQLGIPPSLGEGEGPTLPKLPKFGR